MRGGFWPVEHRSPPPQGGTASYKKKFKTVYSLIQKYNEIHKNLVELDLVHIYSPDTNKYDVFSTQ